MSEPAYDDAGSGVPPRTTVWAQRYRLVRPLKMSNGVETLLAVDGTTGTRVVLKSIDPAYVPPAAKMRFEHETHVLRALAGAGLVGLHDAGSSDGRLFLVQRYVPGRTLEQVLADGPLGLLDALRVAVEVATALEIAHSAGIVHRDVKPANVIVGRERPLGDVTLIDFGFARSHWLHESIRDELVGTVRYLAPEAAGLTSVPTDGRSDLYALGIMLYECLSGAPPFTGPSVGHLLRQHLSTAAPPLSDSGVEVPRAVDAVLERLLRKEPAERYQSAAALVADLEQLVAAVERGDREPLLVVGRSDQRRTLADPAFVGREAELEALRALVREVGAGGRGVVVLEAESGGGKSRLLDETVRLAARAELPVLSGQGVQHAGQRPFALVQGVAHGLHELLLQDPDRRAALMHDLDDALPAVVRALPSLTEVLGQPENLPDGPAQFGEQRSVDALVRLLAAVADAGRPVLLVLDDCQWADRLTVRLLAELCELPGGLPAGLGVVVAFRSDEVDLDFPLRSLTGALGLRPGPLSDDAMASLAESMAGPLPAEVLQTVIRLADGSPFMGAAVLRGLVESGALTGTPRGWVVDPVALADVQAARRAAVVLVRRLELLPERALSLLSVGAVLGKEFDLELAVRLADATGSAVTAVDEARQRRLLWVDERTGRCAFFHDKIREALLQRLDPEERRVLHGRAAEALLRAGSSDSGASDAVFELAYHFDAAGRCAEALPYALAAADVARQRHALDTAAEHYRIAQRGVPEQDLDTRRRIAEGLGDVCTLQGAYPEAERHLEQARGLVDSPAEQAGLEGRLGDLAFKRGDVPTARDHLESALERLGRPVPRRAAWLLLRLLGELVVQVAHTLLPRWTTGRRSAVGAEQDFLAMRLYSRLAYVHWFGSGRVPCAWAHLRGMNLAERYPPSPELGQAWSEHAPVMTMLPWFGRGVRYAERSLEVRRDLGDVWGQGQSASFLAVVHYAASRYDLALDAAREAVSLLDRTGDRWEANTAGWHIALCLYRQGRLVDGAAAARSVHESARIIEDTASAGISLSAWARCAGGRVDAESVQELLALGSDDAHTGCELHLAAALQRRAEGRLDEAREQLERGLALMRRAGLRQEYVAPLLPWYATVLREQLEAWPVHDVTGRRRAARDAASAAGRARRWAWSYRNNRPHALREAGLMASLAGRPARAQRLLARSAKAAIGQGAVYEEALTALATAELRALVDPSAGEERDRAADRVSALEASEPTAELLAAAGSVSLFDRFTTLLKVGRRITAAPTLDALNAAVRDAGLTLLRGERCHLVQIEALDSEHLTTQSGEPIDEVSRTLLARAVELGSPVVASDPTVGDSESLLLSGLRSVLAAPVSVHGEVVCCFYVTHRKLGHLFGDAEVQLAGFIATLTGAALEHLAGSETRFRSLAQESSDVLTLVDGAGTVGYQSPAVTRVFGLPVHGLAGRPVTDWVHPEDQERFAAALARAAHGTQVRVECRVRHADGGFRYAETAITDLLAEPTVAAVVLNTRDVTDRRKLEDELRERALHDSLTGLPNRALFLDRARHAVERGQRHGAPLAVAFFDLDDFKAINDTHGHAAGDELLRAIAQRLVACVRPADTVARLGGDEFAVLLEETDLPSATAAVQRMLELTCRPVPLAGTEVVVHSSIGLTVSTAVDTTPDQLLAQADAAMYSAKQRGKHRYDLFVPAMQIAIESRSRLRTELDRALANDELRLLYQPIVDLGTGQQVGMEALVRWQHPDRGLLAPGEFISVAEDSGQVVDLGAWVLRTACRDVAALGAAGRVSVNVSARQLQHPRLMGDVQAALSESGLPPDRLVLEITETAAVTGSAAEIEATLATLTALKELGLQIALDDFGTGYSPLSYLRRFPVDLLKIDRSFVSGIVGSTEDEAIVRGVIEMAHALGLKTVAEGVEEPAQRELLLGLGCDMGQGYLWSRPTDLDAAAQGLQLPLPRPARGGSVPPAQQVRARR